MVLISPIQARYPGDLDQTITFAWSIAAADRSMQSKPIVWYLPTRDLKAAGGNRQAYSSRPSAQSSALGGSRPAGRGRVQPNRHRAIAAAVGVSLDRPLAACQALCWIIPSHQAGPFGGCLGSCRHRGADRVSKQLTVGPPGGIARAIAHHSQDKEAGYQSGSPEKHRP